MEFELFTQLLSNAYKEKGISIRELARQVEMDPTYISKLLSGTRNPPSNRFIEKLAIALDVDPTILLLSANRLPQNFGPSIARVMLMFPNIRKKLEYGTIEDIPALLEIWSDYLRNKKLLEGFNERKP